jgi:hypothetical protein
MDESMIYGEGTIVLPLYRFGVVTGFSKKLDGTFVSGLKTVDEVGEHSYVLEITLGKLLNGLTEIRAQIKRV